MKVKNNVKFVLDLLATKVSLLILGSITAWLGYLAAGELHERQKVKEEIIRLKDEIIAMEKKNSDLSSLISSFDDRESLELEAKKRLNLKKPGEEVAVIVGANEEAAQKNVTEKEEMAPTIDIKKEVEKDEANPLKWLRYITD